MKKFYEIYFESIVDKGEKFTFNELLSVKENKKLLDDFLFNEVQQKEDKMREEIEHKFKSLMSEEIEEKERRIKELFEFEFKKNEQVLKNDFMKIENDKNNEINNLKNTIENMNKLHDDANKTLKVANEENIKNLRDYISKLEETYSNNLKILEETNSKIEKEKTDKVNNLKETIENMTKSHEEANRALKLSNEENIKTLKENIFRIEETYHKNIQRLEEANQEKAKIYKKIAEEAKEQVKSITEQSKIAENQMEERIRDAVAVVTEKLTTKRKSGTKIGDIGEEEVIEQLKLLFSYDKIFKPMDHSGGADIDHTIVDQGKDVGNIVYEIKNKTSWNKNDYKNFVQKVSSMDSNKNNYFIYVHNKVVGEKGEGAFTKISNNLTFDTNNKIFITNFESVISLVYILRKILLEFNKKIQESENKYTIAEKIYEFIKNDDFINYFKRVEDKRSSAALHFDKIIDNAQKGKNDLSLIKDELKELDDRINKITNLQ